MTKTTSNQIHLAMKHSKIKLTTSLNLLTKHFINEQRNQI